MKKIITLVLFSICLNGILQAHTVSYDKVLLHSWKNKQEQVIASGSFMLDKQGKILIQDAQGKVISINEKELSNDDLTYVKEKKAAIIALNEKYTLKPIADQHTQSNYTVFI